MKISLKFLLLCFLMWPVRQASEAFASPSVTIAPASNNVYTIQCGDFSDISRVDITIQYDAAALAGLRVVQGGLAADAIMAVNASQQGVLRFTLAQPAPIWLRRWTRPESGRLTINGSGTLATVTFVRTMSTGADILSLTASAESGTGQIIAVASQVVNAQKTADSGASTEQHADQGIVEPALPGNSPKTTDDGALTGQQTGRTGNQNTTDSGALTEQQAGRSATESGPTDSRTAHDTTTAVSVSNTPAATMIFLESSSSHDNVQAETPSLDSSDPQADPGVQQKDKDSVVFPEIAKAAPGENPLPKTAEPERKKTLMYKSVLERFREFKGGKTPEALIALFSSGGGDGRQDPPLVLSDGKTTVKVVVELNPKGEDNNFLLDGASLVSLKNKEKNYWIVELLPEKNTLEATISVPRNNQWHVAPLTVSPPRDVAIGRSSGKEAKAAFKRYLKERGTAKAPRFDLNGDGRRDYIDDYIFTANYLARQEPPGRTR